MTPENQDFVAHKLGKLRREKQRAKARLEDLAGTDFKPPAVEATVDAILAQLNDFSRVAAQGTVEERKQFVRAFVGGINIHPYTARGAVHMRPLPVPHADSHAFSLEILTPV